MERVFYSDERTVVQTTCGKIQGYFAHDLYIFKGVPYASAARFCKPTEVEPWEDILDTTSYGYVCPLLNQERPSGELLVPHRYWIMDENCQNLNIWTPGLDGKKRPVIVWLHGGGFTSGSAIEHDAYDGANIARYGDAVVISINHRLNVLGYLDMSPVSEKYADSGNNGGNDIIAALKWIQKNIEAFGGDKDNVTVFGQSGGGAKVTTLLQSPEADGLFHRGAVMSGVFSFDIFGKTDEDPTYLIQALAEELKVTPRELETVPYAQLAAAYNKVSPVIQAQGHYVGGVPKVSDSYVGDPMVVGFRKETQHIPLVVGSVFGEFNFLKTAYDKRTLTREAGREVARKVYGEEADKVLPLFEKAYPERNPADLTDLDVVFRTCEIGYIAKRAETSPVYSYLFDMDFQLENGKPAWHCADIPYVFHNTHMVDAIQVQGVTNRLEEQIFQSLIAFARTGDPNHDLIPQWHPCKPETENTMVFGKVLEEKQNYDHELLQTFATTAVRVMMEAFTKSKPDIKH